LLFSDRHRERHTHASINNLLHTAAKIAMVFVGWCVKFLALKATGCVGILAKMVSIRYGVSVSPRSLLLYRQTLDLTNLYVFISVKEKQKKVVKCSSHRYARIQFKERLNAIQSCTNTRLGYCASSLMPLGVSFGV
jgi:hypothetical protein